MTPVAISQAWPSAEDAPTALTVKSHNSLRAAAGG